MNRMARPFFALTAVVALAGVVISLAYAATSGVTFDSGWKNFFNQFTYFTVMSNILAGGTCVALAISNKERGAWFRALRLDGLICMIITAVVYHAILAADDNPVGWNAVSNVLEHSLSPILVVLGWVVFGPRNETGSAVVKRALIVPIGWLIFTFVRGAITDFYPYDFLDAGVHGYAEALSTVAVITLIFVALAALTIPIDRRLPKR